MGIVGARSLMGWFADVRQSLPPGGAVGEVRTRLWGLSLLFFCVGDLVTTHAGLSIHGVIEAGPVVAPVLREYGIAAMVGLKAATMVLFYGLALALPDPHAVGVPLGLTLVGVFVTGWNLLVISVAVL